MMDTIVQGQNALGEFFLLPLNKDIYSKEAIMKTCYAFTDDYYIHVIKTLPESASICFYNKAENKTAQDIKQAVKAFLHLLHENQLRHILLQETQTLHEEIVRKAFAPAASLLDASSQNAPEHILISAV